MRVLHIDGNKGVREALALGLECHSINATVAENRDDGLHFAEHYEFDAIIMDFPQDATGLLRDLRAKKISTPIIILSHGLGMPEKLLAFELGADDCIEKPCHLEELVARINAVVRRSRCHATSSISFGDLTVNIDRKTVTYAGRAIHLTNKEYETLECLALRRGCVVTKEMFLNHLYGGMDEPELKIIDVFICKLRKKFAPLDPIETIWGRGYTMRETARKVSDREATNAMVA